MEQAGRPVDDVIAELADHRGDDVAWSAGRTFSLVYDGGPTVHDVAGQAALPGHPDRALDGDPLHDP